MKQLLSKALFVFFYIISFYGCQTNDFDKGRQTGYNEGFKAGYERGKTEGYSLGYKAGYENGNTTGYNVGTKIFLKRKWLPTLGGGILIFIALVFIILLFVLLNFQIKLLREKWKAYLVKRNLLKKIHEQHPDFHTHLLKDIIDLRQRLAQAKLLDLKERLKFIANTIKVPESKFKVTNLLDEATKINDQITVLTDKINTAKLNQTIDLYTELLKKTSSRDLTPDEQISFFKEINSSLDI